MSLCGDAERLTGINVHLRRTRDLPLPKLAPGEAMDRELRAQTQAEDNRRAIGEADYQARSVVFLPSEAHALEERISANVAARLEAE